MILRLALKLKLFFTSELMKNYFKTRKDSKTSGFVKSDIFYERRKTSWGYQLVRRYVSW